MKNCYYAAYELRSGKELCMGVWDTIEELGSALEISVKTAYSRMYRNSKESDKEDRFTIKRVAARKRTRKKKRKKKNKKKTS